MPDEGEIIPPTDGGKAEEERQESLHKKINRLKLKLGDEIFVKMRFSEGEGVREYFVSYDKKARELVTTSINGPKPATTSKKKLMATTGGYTEYGISALDDISTIVDDGSPDLLEAD